MSYTALCTVEDIQAWFVKKEWNEDTSPTLTQVEYWIKEATSLIYAAVAEQYLVPIEDKDDLLVLKSLCVEYVRDNVNFMYGGNKITIVEKGVTIPRQVKHEDFWKKLRQIKIGEIILINSPAANSGVYIRSSNVEEEVETVGKKDEIQW